LHPIEVGILFEGITKAVVGSDMEKEDFVKAITQGIR